MGIQPTLCCVDNPRRLLAVVGGVAVALLATLSVTASIAAEQASQAAAASDGRIGHVIVADAGSSHTDFSLYRWAAPAQSEPESFPTPEL